MKLHVIHDSYVPAHRQISDGLRRAILQGEIALGDPLPAIRTLADDLGVSRSTVLRSFNDLASQGYIRSVAGSGSMVASRLPGDLSGMPEVSRRDDSLLPTAEIRLSEYGLRLMRNATSASDIGRLVHGGPSLDMVSIQTWKDLLRQHCRPADKSRLNYAMDPFGYPPLREAYAAYLQRARAVNCDANSVVIFSAREVRANILCRLLLESGDYVAVENPGYPTARQRFVIEGAKVVPCPVDSQGLVVDYLVSLPDRPKFVYVTPSHHEPTGAVLSLSRRKKLLDWAAQYGVFIIEDDYDSEFRYDGRPLPSLQGMDTEGCVIHMSCFWKTLSPVLKLGFLVIPECLKKAVFEAKRHIERDMPLIDQLALTDYINEGHHEKNIRRLRRIYGARREALIRSLRRHFGSAVQLSAESAGMDMLFRLESKLSDEQIADSAAARELAMSSSAPYYVGAGVKGEFIIPFSQFKETELTDGVKRLSASLSQLERQFSIGT